MSETPEIAVGQVWEHRETGLLIRITQVPGGRKRVYRFRYMNNEAGGNGRRFKGERTLHHPSVQNARVRGIPVRVITACEPEAAGTQTEPKAESITEGEDGG